jgi:uncharacterized protein (TIGR02145 family)
MKVKVKSLLRPLVYWLLLLSQPLILITSCDESEQNTIPDYTGQTGQITDIEGHVYNTIGIGSQIWMIENLRTTLLNDGTQIPLVSNDSLWNRIISPGYCWYKNDSTTFGIAYGTLYNFHTVASGLLCPVGWHVPDKSEWETLTAFLGGDDIAGGKLKDYYSSYWQGPNYCIVNNFGFNALPGGKRLSITGRFDESGLRGYWWTSSSMDGHFAISKSMSNLSLKLDNLASGKNEGFNIRCIKDQ